MKNSVLRRVGILGLMFFAGGGANAYELGVVGGLQTTSTTTNVSGAKISDGSGFRLGVLGFIDMGNNLLLRSGAIYTQRKFDFNLEILNQDIKLKTTFNYLDIPVTGMMMFNEMVGLFAGVELGLKMGTDVKSNSTALDSYDGEKSLIYGLQVGGHFRFVPNFGLEVGYTLGLSDMVDDDGDKIEKAKGLFAQLMYLF